ncbi:hypothetical protein RUND412_011075 [Rhizina undulata]
MNRYRGPFSSSTSTSKATPNTRCQKCLKLGHYSYECKSSATERPYVSRPSRTQQLYNPRLRQELLEAAPPPEIPLTRKKGIADEILAKKEKERGKEKKSEERGRKRQRHSPSLSRSHTRSISTASSSSYSSISSGRSPTPPANSQNQPENPSFRPRDSPRRSRPNGGHYEHERSVRRKYRDSPSPRNRGRRMSPGGNSRRSRSRSPKPRQRTSATPHRQTRRSASLSPPRDTSRVKNKHSRMEEEHVETRRPSPHRERSMSPFTRRRLMTEAMNKFGS